MRSPFHPVLAALARLGEKVAWTFVQVFATTIVVADSFGASIAQSAFAAGAASALTVAANGIPDAPAGIPFGVDLLYRSARTLAASSFGAVAAVSVFDWSVSTWQGALLASVPAVMAVLKGGAARYLGSEDTGATLPESIDLEPLSPPVYSGGPVANR